MKHLLNKMALTVGALLMAITSLSAAASDSEKRLVSNGQASIHIVDKAKGIEFSKSFSFEPEKQYTFTQETSEEFTFTGTRRLKEDLWTRFLLFLGVKSEADDDVWSDSEKKATPLAMVSVKFIPESEGIYRGLIGIMVREVQIETLKYPDGIQFEIPSWDTWHASQPFLVKAGDGAFILESIGPTHDLEVEVTIEQSSGMAQKEAL